MDFKQKLKRLALDANLSTREVAERVEVGSHSTVNRWLSGEADPRLSELVRIAEAFGVTVAYLADDTVDDPKARSAALSDADRLLIEKGRRFGAERAAVILDRIVAIDAAEDVLVLLAVVNRLGLDEAMSRLLGTEAKEETGQG